MSNSGRQPRIGPGRCDSGATGPSRAVAHTSAVRVLVVGPSRIAYAVAVRLIGPALLLLAVVAGTGATIATGPSVRVLSHGDRSRPLVALTFDDGISPANCRRLLAILVKLHVPATFFPLAEAMALDPAFWRLVAATGDPIADHTYSHPQMPKLDFAAQVAEIERGRRVAQGIIGRSILPVFRPPYGAYDSTTLKAASQAGFPTVLLWDVSDRDTSPQGTLAHMRAAAELGTNGSVVLMHCGPNATPYLLADVIAFYRDRGIEFVTVPALLHLPWNAQPTRAVSPDEILGSLSPLPSSPSGGRITAPNGYTPPPTGGPASEPSASASPAASIEPQGTATPPATESSPPASASHPARSAEISAQPATGPAGPGVGAAGIAVVATIAAFALIAAITVLARKRVGRS